MEKQITKTEVKHIDPICGMTVDADPELKLSIQGKDYFFCCEGCMEAFQKNPKPKERSTAVGVMHTCPMHPEVQQMGPGDCPICGMALEPLEAQLEDQPNPDLKDFKRKLIVGGILSAPLMFVHLPWLQFAMASPVVFWCGLPLWKKGWQSISTKNLNMFTLILLGVWVAYLFSIAGLMIPLLHGQNYFESAAVITTLVLLGQVLELQARNKTNHAIKALLKLKPKTARKIFADGSEKEIDLEEVLVGDQLRVRPGEIIPVDGGVKEGSSAVDESFLTGESISIEKDAGKAVFAGTMNQSGTLVIEAKKVGAGTLLSKLVKLVNDAQRTRAPIQKLADQVAAIFVPVVIGVAVLTFALWFFIGSEPKIFHAIVAAVSVLIIACPCALGLATPMSIMVAVGKAAHLGILIRNAEAIELLEKVSCFVLDKTGTVTIGKPMLTYSTSDEVLRISALLEKGSEHSIAHAILNAADKKGIALSEKVENFKAISGMGIQAKIGSKIYSLGNEQLLTVNGIVNLQDETKKQIEKFRLEGNTVMILSSNESASLKVEGLIAVADQIKSDSAAAVSKLIAAGKEVILLTGDHSLTANAVAKKVGINEVYASVLPEHKAEFVKKLQASGKKVAMVGDGVNDAPALAYANVGIAMGTGADVAIQSAGITLVSGKLSDLVLAVQISHRTMKNIRQNLFFAYVYNFLGIPLAAFGFLNPMIASAAMSLSSVSVIGNALRLQRMKTEKK